MKLGILDIGEKFVADYMPAGYEDLYIVYPSVVGEIVSKSKESVEWKLKDFPNNLSYDEYEELLGGIHWFGTKGEFDNIRRQKKINIRR